MKRVNLKEPLQNLEIDEYGTLYRDGKKISWYSDKDGYHRRQMYIKGAPHYLSAHRLVAEYFVEPKPAEGLQVNHKDGVKTNNHYSNLEWVTSCQNTRHAYANNLFNIQSNRASGFEKEDFLGMKRLHESGMSLTEIKDHYGWDCRADYVSEILKGYRHSQISGFTPKDYNPRCFLYKTPWGEFKSSRKAGGHVEATYSKPSILKFCRNPDDVIMQGVYKGMTGREAGFLMEDSTLHG